MPDATGGAEDGAHERMGWRLHGELVDRWNRERLHHLSVIDELKSLLCAPRDGKADEYAREGEAMAKADEYARGGVMAAARGAS